MTYEISLINHQFKQTGHGIDVYSYVLYEELKKRNVDINKIEIDQFMNPLLKNIRPNFLNKTIRRKLFFTLKKTSIKNKNVHVLEPLILQKNNLGLPKNKIITVHDFYIFDEKQMIKRIERFNGYLKKAAYKNILNNRKFYDYIKKYDFVFARNESVMTRLIKEFEVEPKNVEVSNGIIPDKFQPDKKERKNDKTIIGFINNFTENKTAKLKVFIEKFKQIKDNSLEFQIYGKGFPFQELIKDDSRIKYLGFLPEEKIVETYNQFDAYLSTSTIEGFGIPIMQAKACKVPVLCYDGDLPEIVKRNTLIWNDENLEEILKNRPWGKVNVEKAYLDAEECRADKVVPKIINVYNRIFV